jgi:hypothetical protein
MKLAERRFHIPAIVMAVVTLLVFLGATVQVNARPLTADFDGDGFDDLAVGAPDEDLGSGWRPERRGRPALAPEQAGCGGGRKA